MREKTHTRQRLSNYLEEIHLSSLGTSLLDAMNFQLIALDSARTYTHTHGERAF